MFLPTLFGVSCRDIFLKAETFLRCTAAKVWGIDMKLLQILRPGRDMYVWDVTRAVAAHSFRRNCCRREQGLISSPLFNKLHIQSGSNMAHHNPHVASTWPNIFPTWFKTAFWVVVLVLVLVLVLLIVVAAAAIAVAVAVAVVVVAVVVVAVVVVAVVVVAVVVVAVAVVVVVAAVAVAVAVVLLLLVLVLVVVVVVAGAARFNPVFPDAFSFVSMGSVGIFPADQ